MYIVQSCTCMYKFVHIIFQNWSKLQTNGTKPPARFFHTTCCVGGQLMVVGGYGYPVFSDVWLLNVTSGSWSEVLHAHGQGILVCG